MEREDYYNSPNNKMDLLKYLSKNYENFMYYFINALNEEDLMISNNEISMVYFNNLEYQNKNENSYTFKNLNNLYINTNKCLSGKDIKYSFTLDNKLAFVKKYIDETQFRYDIYNSIILNIPSIYQLSKNYYINGYVDILKYNDNNTNNLLYTINQVSQLLLSNLCSIKSNKISKI
jgi:hypothetical protein